MEYTTEDHENGVSLVHLCSDQWTTEEQTGLR